TCGFTHSTLATVPFNVIGLPMSNSAWNEWCANAEPAVISAAAAVKAVQILNRMRQIMHFSGRFCTLCVLDLVVWGLTEIHHGGAEQNRSGYRFSPAAAARGCDR